MTDTVAFVQEWLANADYDPTQFDKDFAAAIDAREDVTQLDESDEAMICTGCGTTRSIAGIKQMSETAFSCCPERKMVAARDMWRVWRGVHAITPKVASDTGAGLVERLRERASGLTTMLGEPAWKPSRAHIETARNLMTEAAAALATDATDGATGGGEVDHGLGPHALPIEDEPDGFDPVWHLKSEDTVYLQQRKAQIFLSHKQAAILALNTPGGDLLEQAALIQEWEREKRDWRGNTSLIDRTIRTLSARDGAGS